MAARRILQLGDPELRRISRPVTSVQQARSVLGDLADTLHAFQKANGFGRGIAAIQIGEPLRIVYIETDHHSYHLIDPVIEWRSDETFRLWDDCFSFPDLMVLVERAQRVRVRYREASGAPAVIEAEGPLSELLQHELDHLDGVLAIDRAVDRDAFCTRAEYLRRIAPSAAAGQGCAR